MSTAGPTLPSDYESLLRELHLRAAAFRQPVNGTFELTERCNLACRMCYVGQEPGDAARRAKELPASAWLELARHAVDNGMVFLLLTGGEIFLRPDFFELYTPLTRLGIFVTLFTNGTLISDALAARLAEAPPSRTEITLYGATAATYEAVTGVRGGYARCCTGIEALVKHRVPLGLKTTLTRQNVGELDAMRQMAHNWGLPFAAGWLLSKRRDGALSEVANCRLFPYQCVDLEATARASGTDWTEAALRESSLSHDRNFHCQAGRAAFVINPLGEMNACVDLALPAARPLEVGFRRAWEQVQYFVDSAPPLAPLCVACDARTYCPRCPGWSQLETGTLSDPVPYLCEIANARKERYAPSCMPSPPASRTP
jgi:radical SAM protein with 4Fe4S-binding SPASM domain